MGYKRTEETKKLNDKTTLIYYKKRKVKRLKYALPFLCYSRLNIQKRRIFFQNTRVSNFIYE